MQSPASELKFDFPNRFIRAGAGAGKTTRLISTFVEFVQNFKAIKNKYPKVILTTFTRKSTQEIKERLLTEALKLKDQDLFSYINKKSSVHISTIHGVLGLFLNQYQDVIGLSADFKVLDEEQIRKQSFKELKSILKTENKFIEILEHYSFSDLLKHLNAAFEFANENTNIAFVDGTQLQKIRTKEFQRLQAVLETILALPIPSGKGWSEYFSALSTMLDFFNQNNFNQVLQVFENMPRKPNFSADKPAFDTDLHEELKKYFSGSTPLILEFDTDDYIAENQKLNALFFELLNIYSTKIKEARKLKGEITISDLETLVFSIIQASPESAKQFANEFDYFMIDEFQDTSPMQLKILNEFIKYKPHFIVGDPQQSIYLFRGARSEVFLSKQTEALKGQFENIRLNTNYRSRPSLMRFMNDYFTHFSTSFEPMIPKDINPEDSKKNNESFFDGYYIQSEDECLATLNHIQRLISLGAKASNICVLSKKNSVLMDLSAQAAKYNLPVQLVVAAGFDERREILDLCSFVRFLVNPYDTENLIQLLRSPWFLITDDEIVQLRQQKNENHFWLQIQNANIVDSDKLQKYLLDYQTVGVLHALLHFIEDTDILNSCQYLDPSGKKEANIWKFVQGLRDQMNHKSFHLNEYLTNQFLSLQSDLASNMSEAQPVVSPDRVTLMTIHTAKGLQFEHVIVMGLRSQPNTSKNMQLSTDENTGLMNLGIFSAEDSQIQNSFWGRNIRKQFNEREIDESERVLYVAMTRAMISVALIAEDHKSVYKASWFGKSKWPEIGESRTSDFSYCSLRDDEVPTVQSLKSKTEIQVKPPFQILTEAVNATESITEMLDKKTADKNSSKISDYFLQNLNKAKTGTELHKLFEALKYNSLTEVQAVTSEKNKKYLNYLLDQKEIPLQQVFDTGFTEWGFGLKHNDKLIQGQIDIWGKINNTVYILDYKTGSAEHLEKAYLQLGFYAACLKQMKLIAIEEKIILGVIYPAEEKVFTRGIEYKDLLLN